ncbi:MAG: hypothetical protein SAK29_38070 [Scytonema sp. PMC 1069.18]|nr:hypothetical protein [Scytonema sp. PMC 1069.18]MEC4883757.1 hypothetical protein [Scytonema sp. PMC 1070.18]
MKLPSVDKLEIISPLLEGNNKGFVVKVNNKLRRSSERTVTPITP